MPVPVPVPVPSPLAVLSVVRTCGDHGGQAQIRENTRPAILFEPISKSAAVEAYGAPHPGVCCLLAGVLLVLLLGSCRNDSWVCAGPEPL